MDVRITIRRGSVGETLRQRAEQRARKLVKYEPRLLAVDLLFDEDRGRSTVEARSEVPGRPLLVAGAAGDTGRSALDQALQRLGRQLRKDRSRKVDHQAPPTVAVVRE